MFGMVRSKYLPGGLHGCEGSAISVGALSAFRAAVARAVWSRKLPMTNTPALLNLLESPWIWPCLLCSMGSFLGSLGGIWHTGRMKWTASSGFLTTRLLSPLGMDPSTCSLTMLLRLVSLGTRLKLAGLGLPPLRMMTVVYCTSAGPFGRPGRAVWPLTFVSGRGSRASFALTFVVSTNSLSLLT